MRGGYQGYSRCRFKQGGLRYSRSDSSEDLLFLEVKRYRRPVVVLIEELEEYPAYRLSLRVGCRTAEWPKTLEDGMKRLWEEESVRVYERAPLRRVDVVMTAEANGLDSDAFLGVVREAQGSVGCVRL